MMFLELVCVQLGCRILLTVGQFALTLSESDSSLWIGASEAVTVEQHTELFGFGSGNYAKDSEGADIMTDTSSEGRWLLYSFTSGTNLVILEKQGQTPEHLANAAFWNKAAFIAMWLSVSFLPCCSFKVHEIAFSMCVLQPSLFHLFLQVHF